MPQKTERIRVLDRKVEIDLYDFFENKTIDELQHAISALATAYERDILLYDKYVNFSIERYGYDGGMDLYLKVWRLENDQEYAKRMEKLEKSAERSRKAKEAKKEAARKALFQKEADERAEYERLRAKFGDTTDTLEPTLRFFKD